MTQPVSRDVTGIGNAIVDIIAQTDDAFLDRAIYCQGRHDIDRRGCCDPIIWGDGARG